MSKLTRAQQKAKVAATIKINGNKEITPPKDKILRDDQLDSCVNSKDGGYEFEAAVGYLTELSVSDPKAFVALFQVEVIAAAAAAGVDLSPYFKADGSIALTGNADANYNDIVNINKLIGDELIIDLVAGEIKDNANALILNKDRKYYDSTGTEVFSADAGKFRIGVTGATVDISTSLITATRNRLEPDKDGTYAMLSDFQWTDTGSDIYRNSNVMIGDASAPLAKLHTVNTSTSTLRGVVFDQYNTGTNSSQINLRKARGTYAAPTTIVTGDILSNLNTWAHDGTNFVNAAAIRVASVGTVATGRTATQMMLMTMTDVTTGVLTTALTLDQTQKGTFANTVELTTLSVKDFTSGLYQTALVSNASGQLQLGSQAALNRINAPSVFYMHDENSTFRKTFASNTATLTVGEGWAFMNVASLSRFSNSFSFNTPAAAVSVTGTMISATAGVGFGSAYLWSGNVNQTLGSGVVAGFSATPTTISSVTGILAGFYSNIAASPTGGGVGYAQYHAGTGSHYFGDSSIVAGTATGVKLLTATGQKLGIWGATPITQPNTSVASATFVSNGGTALTSTDTFDGYTLAQIVRLARLIGLAA
ncbi:MAG: hypothetical protein V4687_16010 [Bacteroidota bacterium]